MTTLRYRILLRKEDGGTYTVIVPSLPGCLTFGHTVEEALGSHHFYHNPETKKSTIVPFHGKDVPKGLMRFEGCGDKPGRVIEMSLSPIRFDS